MNKRDLKFRKLLAIQEGSTKGSGDRTTHWKVRKGFVESKRINRSYPGKELGRKIQRGRFQAKKSRI